MPKSRSLEQFRRVYPIMKVEFYSVKSYNCKLMYNLLGYIWNKMLQQKQNNAQYFVMLPGGQKE